MSIDALKDRKAESYWWGVSRLAERANNLHAPKGDPRENTTMCGAHFFCVHICFSDVPSPSAS